MEIRSRQNKSGTVWVVRWREGGKRHARTLRTRELAEAFAAKQQLDLERHHTVEVRGAMTLDDFLAEWQRGHGTHLAQSTQDSYVAVWNRYIGPALGSHTLIELSERPELIQQFHADLAQRTGAPTVRRTLLILQGVLQRAIEWNRIRYNPVAAIRKPRGNQRRAVHPLTPEQVECVIGELMSRKRLGDATLISVLAYAGLRPGEALALQWRHVRKRTMLVEAAVADGELKSTKTGRVRAVHLLPTLAEDLANWKACQEPLNELSPLFPGSASTYWKRHDWNNWRKRVFVPAMAAAGIVCTRPYDLRHSFCSLLIAEGRSVVEVAQQMGHAPEMTLSTYAHVFAEAGDPLDRLPASDQIARARAARLGAVASHGLELDPNVLRGVEEIDWSGHKTLHIP